ncbi:MAG TPA: DNA-deoxyinosine glycosylase [Xanthomonadales bacterium]|nr:DNA-deoxyinosine glycosylase [Xanthomonadales bacterium]
MATTVPFCTSFPPILPRRPTLLVLGSMPGARSLAEQRYYAHPQNLFWRAMAAVCDVDPAQPYARRVAQLRASGIAVWDVLQHCERPGSLDGAIVRESEVPNEIAALLAARKSIRAVAFNGGKARDAFRRHVLPALTTEVRARIAFEAMPSTSPAYAALDASRKLAQWARLQQYIENAA